MLCMHVVIVSKARVLVVLRNVGKEAYQPEKYGNAIHVERVIKKGGASAYYLKSEHGMSIALRLCALLCIRGMFGDCHGLVL
jgi:hypothetical protein